MRVPLRTAATILDEVEQIYDHVTKRAYDIFLRRGGVCTLDIEDWLEAEKELLWKPDIAVIEAGGSVEVTVHVGEHSARNLEVLITPHDVLVQSQSDTGVSPLVFRTLHFNRRIDPETANAEYADGRIVLRAKGCTL